MNWPKRFALHEAAARKPDQSPFQTDVVQAHGNRLIAVDGVGVAMVPVLAVAERSGADLPRLEPDERPPMGVIPPKAIQEAAHGSTGEGRLVVVSPAAVEAQRGPGKPWVRFDRPPTGELPPVAEVFEIVDRPAPEGHRSIEVSLDAEALVRLSRAIGAQEAVRLRFLVDEQGRCSGEAGAHAFIDVRDVRNLEGGARAVLAAFVVSGQR